MMKFFSPVLLAALFVGGEAVAQQPQPFVAITLDETAFNELRGYLMEQPAKFAVPLLQWLEQKQNAARMAKMRSEAVPSVPPGLAPNSGLPQK